MSHTHRQSAKRRAALRQALAAGVHPLFRRDGEPPKLYRRNSALTPDSLQREARRVRSVLTTEDPALVFDWQRGQVILEVLLVDGGDAEDQTPLIRDHRQYDCLMVCGSATEPVAERDELLGWLCFGRELDEESEAIWRRVEQGFLRRVSIGYDYGEGDYVTVPAGETRQVAGKSFTAPKDRDLRVVTRWRLREVSLVVIPADPRAQMRAAQQGTLSDGSQQSTIQPALGPGDSQNGEGTMKKFLQFLHRHGLAKNVTDVSAALRWASDGNLTEAQIGELAKYCEEDGVTFVASQARAKIPDDPGGSGGGNPGGGNTDVGGGNGSGGNTPGTRGNLTTQQTAVTVTDPAPLTAEQRQAIEAEATRTERERVAAIRQLHTEHPHVDLEVVEGCVNDGSSIEATQTAFLAGMRSRTEGVGPAVHVRGGDQVNQRVLQAAFLERCGVRPDAEFLRTDLVRNFARQQQFDIGWLCNQPESGPERDAIEQAFDIAGQRGLRNVHSMRLAQALAEFDAGHAVYDEEEVMQRAFSSGGFSAVYGATVHLQLLQSYAITAAKYERFCEVVDVSDFRKNSQAEMTGVGRLRKQGKNGGKAALLNVDDPVLSAVLVDRYAGHLQVTDQMVINDMFGVTGQLPIELGKTCRHMIMDLAMAQVLRTDNLDDGAPRYDAGLGNSMDHAAVDEDMWTNLGTLLKAKKVAGRRIEVEEGVVLAGVTRSPQVRKWMRSEEINEAKNPHAGTYESIEDSAIDLGVQDPHQEDLDVAGTPNNLYAFAGSQTKRSITVAFRRGTNRGPVLRNYILTEGEWGIGWDVYMDMGAAFRRRVGTVRVRLTG